VETQHESELKTLTIAPSPSSTVSGSFRCSFVITGAEVALDDRQLREFAAT